jgi:YggT family protein
LNIFICAIYLVAMIYGWLIVARALLSWFRLRHDHPLFRVRRVLTWLTEPYLRLFRGIIPTARIGAVGLDLSAMVGLIVLFVVVQVVARL